MSKNTNHQLRHLVCLNCGILLDCDWMGISLDYDDICKEGHHHTAREVNCDCESKVIING